MKGKIMQTLSAQVTIAVKSNVHTTGIFVEWRAKMQQIAMDDGSIPKSRMVEERDMNTSNKRKQYACNDNDSARVSQLQ